MKRKSFTFADVQSDCQIDSSTYQLLESGSIRELGVRVTVPGELTSTFPYNETAYSWLQFLRPEIFEFGIIEFPGLPVNPVNHTLAQRAPKQHQYSSNPYLTDECQSPHQDTPPYPTAFWLGEPRRYFSTWVVGVEGCNEFYQKQSSLPKLSVEELHSELVGKSLEQQTGFLVNQEPGLLLIDNSEANRLYHARTCNFDAVRAQPDYEADTPMYAFNEIGLLHYMDQLDCRRGLHDRENAEVEEVRNFIQAEGKS
jgi:hypothetical protein